MQPRWGFEEILRYIRGLKIKTLKKYKNFVYLVPVKYENIRTRNTINYNNIGFIKI
jgi:hypothetical protein